MIDHTHPLLAGAGDALARHLERLTLPTWEVKDDAPDTPEDVGRCYRETGRLVVWGGASEGTVWGDPTLNYAFRAWHDWCHVLTGFGFTPGDEYRVTAFQLGSVQSDQLARLVYLEVAGQARHFETYGSFIDDQLGWTIDQLAKGGS